MGDLRRGQRTNCGSAQQQEELGGLFKLLGRELRVMVNPEKITDEQAYTLARNMIARLAEVGAPQAPKIEITD